MAARILSGSKGERAPWGHGLTEPNPPVTEEGKGETEIRSPCECEALVQFQTNTVAILQSLTEKNILWGDAWACQGAEGSVHMGEGGIGKWEQGNFSSFKGMKPFAQQNAWLTLFP